MTAAPRISICQLTTPHDDFAADVAAYGAAGATGIGLSEAKLPADDARAGALLRAAGLAVTHCVPAVGSILPGPELAGPSDPDERVAALCRAIERFAAFAPVACTCLTGPAGALAPEEARRQVVDGLRAAALVAGRCGTRLALEPCGPQFAADWSLVDGIEPAVTLIDEVGSPDLCLLVDVWHLWDSPTFAGDVQRHAHRIAGFHVGDRREVTRGLWDRALPGQGIADLPAKIRAIEATGFGGWYDIEIFSDDGTYGTSYEDSLWRLPGAELARRAVEGFRDVWLAA